MELVAYFMGVAFNTPPPKQVVCPATRPLSAPAKRAIRRATPSVWIPYPSHHISPWLAPKRHQLPNLNRAYKTRKAGTNVWFHVPGKDHYEASITSKPDYHSVLMKTEFCVSVK